MRCIGYLERILACHCADLSAFVPWHAGGVAAGFVHRDRVPRLLEARDLLDFVDGRLVLAGDDFPARSASMEAVVRRLVAAGEVRAAQGESYPVFGPCGTEPLLQIDRAAVPWFGVHASGVHVNGWVRTAGGPDVWIARRARGKRTFPGHLDNVVAGGQPIGLTPLQTLVKECAEEAGIPAELASRALPVGVLDYAQQEGRSLKVDSLVCFDLELPPDFLPFPHDGEVEAFSRLKVDQLAASLFCDAPWKPNCAMVALHFLLRWGLLDGEASAAERWRLWQALHGALP